jgi:hypothetical protein
MAHLLDDTRALRTAQGPLGHQDVSTTMISTRVLLCQPPRSLDSLDRYSAAGAVSRVLHSPGAHTFGEDITRDRCLTLSTMPFGRFTELLDEFDRLPPRPKRLPTLMDIAGYPHYENVCSNILRFFFDPEGAHGLGTLLLDVLARVRGLGIPERALGANVSVEREVITGAPNRIDLLIQFDGYDILIENKIFAGRPEPIR